MRRSTHKESSRFVPNHHNDPIKDVVWILNVAKRTINKDFQQHLQGKEACEDNVADLQGIGKFLWLGKEEEGIDKTASSISKNHTWKHNKPQYCKCKNTDANDVVRKWQ